jgi:hypothetical protein
MTTDTCHDDLLLLSAADAIVEAEWIGLHYDQDSWDREFAELCAGTPTLCRRTPRARTAVTVHRSPGAVPPPGSMRWRARRPPRRQIWATQRSPPVIAAPSHMKMVVRQRR